MRKRSTFEKNCPSQRANRMSGGSCGAFKDERQCAERAGSALNDSAKAGLHCVWILLPLKARWSPTAEDWRMSREREGWRGGDEDKEHRSGLCFQTIESTIVPKRAPTPCRGKTRQRREPCLPFVSRREAETQTPPRCPQAVAWSM